MAEVGLEKGLEGGKSSSLADQVTLFTGLECENFKNLTYKIRSAVENKLH